MLARFLLGLGTWLLLSLAAVAAPKDPEECPTLDGDERRQLLKNAPSCDRSIKLFEACAYGASGDVELGAIVVEKCEGDFVGKLSKAERKAYDAKLKRCRGKYAKQSGTMYRSFEAFCAAEVAQGYSRKALKASAQKK